MKHVRLQFPCVTCVLALFLVAVPAAAAAPQRALGVSGELGLGGVGDSAVTTIQTGLDVREGTLALGLFGRVRLVLEGGDDGGVRGRDWDEVADYVHIMRYLHYSRTFHSEATGAVALTLQAGEILGFTLGHGTLIRDYSNVADPDHLHTGAHVALAGERWRFDGMIDNVIAPSVVAARVAVRPFASMRGLRIGSSVVADPAAPVVVTPGEDGLRPVDVGWNLQAESRALVMGGVEVELEVAGEEGKLTPYLDVNFSGFGAGAHAGGLGEVALGARARLVGQLEYRAGSAGYLPAYVETFHDIDRYQASLAFADPDGVSAADQSPKMAGLVRGHFGGQGVLGQVGVDVERWVQAKIGASYRPGPDAVSLWWRATTNPVERLHIGAMMVVRGLEDDSDGGAGIMALAEGRYRITSTLFGAAQYSRTWSLRAADRYFGILQSFNVSFGAAWSG